MRYLRLIISVFAIVATIIGAQFGASYIMIRGLDARLRASEQLNAKIEAQISDIMLNVRDIQQRLRRVPFTNWDKNSTLEQKRCDIEQTGRS